MAENTNICLQRGPRGTRKSLLPSGGRLASCRNGFVASSDLITKKGGHRAGGIAGSRAEPLPNIPWLSRLPKHHHLQSCTELISPLHGESPGTGFHTMGFSIAKKTLNDTDLRVLASPLLMEHASAFTSK